VPYSPVNVSSLAKTFAAGETVGLEELKAKGLIPGKAKRVKVLGNGDLPHALTVRAHAFSKAAQEKIQGAGGTAEVIPEKRQVDDTGKDAGGEG